MTGMKTLCRKNAGRAVSLCRFDVTSSSPYIRFEYGRHERQVKCLECGIIIPRDMPRFYLYEPYSSWKGHYCLDCGLGELEFRREDLQVKLREMLVELREIKAMEQLVKLVKKTRGYQKLLKCVKLIEKVDCKWK